MAFNPLKPAVEDLPDDLPIFPLSRVLLLPRGQLPLNVFEPRYLQMFNDALAGERMIGMIQPRQEQPNDNMGLACDPHPEVFDIGCAGRISSFEEADNGCMRVTLTGVCRFRVIRELPLAQGGYRHVQPQWEDFSADLASCKGAICRNSFVPLLRSYMKEQGLSCSWTAVDSASDETLITCLSMICPFDSHEKQLLLEAKNLQDRARILTSLLEMALRKDGPYDCCH